MRLPFQFRKFWRLIFFSTLVFFNPAHAVVGRPVAAIDLGHLPKSPGAISARGITEYSFNKNMAARIARELNRINVVDAILINPDGISIGLADRTALAKKMNAEFFLSVHHDSVQSKYLKTWRYNAVDRVYSDNFSGYSLFYSERNQFARSSFRAAELIGEQLRRDGFIPTAHHAEAIQGENRPFIDPFRGIYKFDDLVVLRTAPMPAVLVECGIILNRTEEKHLSNPAYQNKLARAIAIGLSNFVKELYTEKTWEK